MKKFLTFLGCVVALVAAGLLGHSYGLFNAPVLDTAGRYGASVTKWARGGFQGSPADGVVDPATATHEATRTAVHSKAELAQLISESKQRAVVRYPDLAVANTEMNSRFVFRYNYLVKENNARLREPNWPEMLADECAAAAQVHARPGHDKNPAKGPASVTSAKKMVASTTP